MPSRRSFLSGVAGSLAGWSAASLPEVRRAVAEALDAQPAGLPVRQDYGLDPAITYLNHASIGTVPKLVQAAHHAYLTACETNPALHLWGDAWVEALASARGALADVLHCDADELAITHNTTEGFNVLAHGLPLGPADEVLFSSLNHPGASLCWQRVGSRRGYRVREFVLSEDRAAALSKADIVQRHVDAVEPATQVLVLPHIDNIIGLRLPVAEIAAAVKAKGVRWVAVDGAQSAGMIDIDLRTLGVDFFAGSPHKWLQSPKGLGLLYCNRQQLDVLEPMWTTWGQERWKGTARIFEDYGTRDLAKVLALGDAVEFHQRTLGADRMAQSRKLWNHAKARAVAHAATSWASPIQWELASAICTVRVRGDARRKLLDETLPAKGLVYRVFHRADDSLVRLSPNVVQGPEALDRFFDLLG